MGTASLSARWSNLELSVSGGLPAIVPVPDTQDHNIAQCSRARATVATGRRIHEEMCWGAAAKKRTTARCLAKTTTVVAIAGDGYITRLAIAGDGYITRYKTPLALKRRRSNPKKPEARVIVERTSRAGGKHPKKFHQEALTRIALSEMGYYRMSLRD